jgi:2-polyprenyl-6-hydroxyphenyl methylase/3-demethylubiquinone-9 3-methyltransferase
LQTDPIAIKLRVRLSFAVAHPGESAKAEHETMQRSALKDIRRFFTWNQELSNRVRRLLARTVPACGPDGMLDFRDRVLPSLLKPGAHILEIGGGKHPAIPANVKEELSLHIVGQDISEDELLRAEAGLYDRILVGDVSTVKMTGNYDLIFSRAVLEHVEDPAAAIANLAQVLTPGGVMAHVMPCRNAPFAVLNRWLGNRLARRVLFTLFPKKRSNSGFPARYRDCTPTALARACHRSGLKVLKVLPYYNSSYTSFFVPLYTVEALRQAATASLRLRDYAESFCIIARRPKAS